MPHYARLWIPLSPLVLAAATAGYQSIPHEAEAPAMQATKPVCGQQHDFDFLVGTWDVHNRRLKARHVGSDEWDEFPARASMRLVLGGLGNVDEIDFPTKGWSGATLRLFDPARRQWWIYWVNSRDGIMLPPVVGGFTGDRGDFFGDDTDDGRPIRVRYRWTRLVDGFARWEQAFSLDGEASWETNWVMEMRRAV
jgi:hypothetical protein